MSKVLWSAMAMLVVCGCGGNGPVPVHGVVALDDRPLAGATVTFVPASPGAREAHAFSSADGSFKMSTYEPHDGAVPGEYKVLVTYVEPIPGLPPGATQEEAQQALTKWALTRKHPPLVVPETYANPETTKLRQKVPPEGPVRLELRGKG
jgi:hypothetical protein